MKFGDRVVAIRKEKGLQQKELAAMISILPVVLSRYENNLINPSLEVANKIAKALGISLDYLANGIEDTSRGAFSDKLKLFDKLLAQDQEYVVAVLEAFMIKKKFNDMFKHSE